MYYNRIGLGLGMRRSPPASEPLVEGFLLNPFWLRIWDAAVLVGWISENTEDIYIKVQLHGDPAPTPAQVKASPTYTVPSTASELTTFLIEELEPHTRYDIYFVAASADEEYVMDITTLFTNNRAFSSGFAPGFF